jgi:hypothetical protein
MRTIEDRRLRLAIPLALVALMMLVLVLAPRPGTPGIQEEYALPASKVGETLCNDRVLHRYGAAIAHVEMKPQAGQGQMLYYVTPPGGKAHLLVLCHPASGKLVAQAVLPS